MAVLRNSPALDQRTDTPREPFDAALSLRLDKLIIALDAQPRWAQRTTLRIRKRWIEREVPAFYSSGRTGQ